MKFIKGKETFMMYLLVSVDSNMAANLANVLSSLSDYCMGCFLCKLFLKSDTVVVLSSTFMMSISVESMGLCKITGCFWN